MNQTKQKQYRDKLKLIIKTEREHIGDKKTLKKYKRFLKYKIKAFYNLQPICDESIKLLRKIESEKIKIIKNVINDIFLIELIKEKEQQERESKEQIQNAK
ncbi:hypothetical protein CWO85_03000 [Candidatus Phytoplasma ziziphi]|uniref:Uncharacterized protein n=1 Tax=Ziziphus jujuba witches'-broom phytoplasma TaxID=135727 RepID=A0A660HNS7_ZIZJU|nr:hypothetical protein [Candidatus Phytoplasma ziziphi]AYJ01446.1 hypothetical protein CWO85_03000 [Candidatus Phytoplasma ziziphi]